MNRCCLIPKDGRSAEWDKTTEDKSNESGWNADLHVCLCAEIRFSLFICDADTGHTWEMADGDEVAGTAHTDSTHDNGFGMTNNFSHFDKERKENDGRDCAAHKR